MTLQDIHKEAVERFYGANNPKMEDIAAFYDKKIVEILKDSIPYESYGSDNPMLKEYTLGFNTFRKQLIQNLKARNINLD